jgi:beta-lactamase superfamily II metal-dependent hydrolase
VAFEVDFLPVGDSNGDAIIVRHGTDESFYLNVVDGGFTDTADTIIKHIEKYSGDHVSIHHMVLSHADNDHATGLVAVLERFEVHELWMNRPWLYVPKVIDKFHGNWTQQGLIDYIKSKHEYLVELEAIATRKKTQINDVFQEAQIGPFTVLAPSRDRYIRLIPDLEKTPPSYAGKGILSSLFETAKQAVDAVKEAWDIETLDDNPPATSASNETSVVQLGVIDGRKILLTADVGPEGLNEAADYADALGLLEPPNFLQIPHHGSRRNVTPAVLDRWLGTRLADATVKRGTAFASVGKDADIYPRKKVKNAFIRRGYKVHATRGVGKRHHLGFGERANWSEAIPEQFDPNVSDED